MIATILTIIVIVVVFVVLYKIFKLIMSLILIAVFLLIAFVSNPDLESHRQAVHEKFGAHAANQIKVDDFYIFGLTQTKSENKVIGAGAFTQVFIFRSVD